MSADRSSLQVQIWQAECGAQANELTEAVCAASSATGVDGIRMSKMMVFGLSARMVAR
jgi:hypothetical protein